MKVTIVHYRVRCLSRKHDDITFQNSRSVSFEQSRKSARITKEQLPNMLVDEWQYGIIKDHYMLFQS